MSDYLQENRRAVVMLVVALCIAALGGLYLLLSSGEGDAQAQEPVPHASPSVSPTIEPVEPEQPTTDAIVTTVVGRSNANPFTPLQGSEDAANEPTSSSPPKKSPSPSPTPSKTTQSSPKDPVNVDGSTTSDSTKSDGKKKKPVDPVPKPIDNGKDAEDSVPVTVLSLRQDYIVARVDGDRTRLYLAVPGVQGVTYVSPLGGNCVWLGRADKPARVSVCKGTTERL